jgi:hypothetical protein
MSSKVDEYLKTLTRNKSLGNIVILEAENKLLDLKVLELEDLIKENEKYHLAVEENKTKDLIQLNTLELSLRIVELQTKTKLNNILITRVKRSIPDDKQ